MAILSETDRARAWRALMRYWSNQRESVAVTKDQLRAAVDAVDSWIDANGAALNTALPAAARTALTLEQKALVLATVALMRRSPDLVARIAEID